MTYPSLHDRRTGHSPLYPCSRLAQGPLGEVYWQFSPKLDRMFSTSITPTTPSKSTSPGQTFRLEIHCCIPEFQYVPVPHASASQQGKLRQLAGALEGAPQFTPNCPKTSSTSETFTYPLKSTSPGHWRREERQSPAFSSHQVPAPHAAEPQFSWSSQMPLL